MTEFLLQGGRANCESFEFIQARFRITQTWARTESDALEGNWLEEPAPVPCEVFWAFHGDTFRMDTVYTPEVMKKYEHKVGSLTARNFVTTYAVWNSVRQMSYHAYPPGQFFFVAPKGELPLEGWNPFNIGMGYPPHEQAETLRKKFGGRVSYLGERELGGRSLPIVEFYWPADKPQIDEYWIDIEHGYHPVRTETYFGDKEKWATSTVVTEFLEVEGGRWLPKRARFVDRNVTKGTPIQWIEYTLDEVDVANPPNADVFELVVPPDARGHTRINGRDQLIISPTGRVKLGAFRSDGTVIEGQPDVAVYQPAGGAGVAVGIPEESLDTKSSVPRWLFAGPASSRTHVWLWAVAAAAVAACAAVLAARRLSKR